MTDRREFLKLLARGATYAAPVVVTYSVPSALAGQGMSSQHKHQHGHGAAAVEADEIGGPPPGRNPPGN